MLQQDAKNRPSCEQLCESNLFLHYTEKLAQLDIVDSQFMKTIEKPVAVNSMLKTIYIPHELKQLTGFLPK
jgi:hypothetical protein